LRESPNTYLLYTHAHRRESANTSTNTPPKEHKNPAIAAREQRIQKLSDWVSAAKSSGEFEGLEAWEVREKVRLRAMADFYLAGRTANEYAAIVIEKLGLNKKGTADAR
jgi:hypothetical protein